MYQFIQYPHEFADVLEKMSLQDTYALDSEFIKVDTLWPKLGVFQINLQEKAYLLDGTSLDFSLFWQKIKSAKQTIFHACSEDIDLIYHYADMDYLSNVFDTQVAMAFLGYGLQVSYQNALKQILNIEIEKDQTRSDWLARPLTNEQLTYAANDVEYLPALAQALQQQLNDKNILSYVLEDCASLTKEIATKTPAPDLYKDVANYRHSRRQLMQIQQVTLWREQIVRALNVPRSFILKNATIIDLVEKNPRNHFQLANIKGIRPNVIREHGKVILDLLKFLPEKEHWPQTIARPIKFVSQHIAQELDATIDRVVTQTQIPKPILMRKKWMNDLYHYVVLQQDDISLLPSYLTGWRYSLLTQPLLNLLQQDSQNLAQQMKIRR